MAIFQIGDASPEFAYFEDLYVAESLALSTNSANTAVFEDSNGFQIVLHGSGFAFSSGRITAGQITSVEFLDDNGGSLIGMTGGNFAAFATTLGLAPGEIDLWAFMSALTAGNDEIHGSSLGNDLNLGANEGNDLIVAGDGGSFMTGSDGKDVMKGGAGWDTISFESTFWLDDDKRGIVLNAAKGTILDSWGDKDTFDKKFEEYDGSIYADKFIGSKRDDVFAGMKGKDNIDGAGGKDEVRYNRDRLRGGDDGVVIDLDKGKAKDGFGTIDTIKNVERAVGTFFDDVFKGGDGDNAFLGLSGIDSFNGRKGKDEVRFEYWEEIGQHGVDVDLTLSTGQIKDDGFGNVETTISIESLGGGNLNDKLKLGSAGGWAWGGSGDDILTAGRAGDWLGGSSGADTFVFLTAAAVGDPGKNAARSYIDDFSHAEGDLIDFSAIGGMTFIGTDAFSSVAGQLRYQFQNGSTFLQGDMDGNGQVDIVLELNGEVTLVSGDFVLS
jgi:serralysin